MLALLPMKRILGLSLTVLLIACQSMKDQKPPVLAMVDYAELTQVLQQDDDVLYLVNFWATWCKPCVEELPHFIEVNKEMANNEQFKMIFVSLDRSEQLQLGVKAMVESKNINADVYLLNDPTKMDEWISATDVGWSGAIPATVLYKNKKKLYFHEGQLSETELKSIIQQHI